MSDEFQQFLGELAHDGKKDGGGSTFTLRSDKAREKLKKFALAHPENYFLLIVASLHTLSARNFRLYVDADDLIVEADCRIGRDSLKDLWAHVAGGAGSQQAVGLRLLALAMLTSVRFQKVQWTIEAPDEDGGFTFRQWIDGGKLPDPTLDPGTNLQGGCRVSVKRKSLTQVAGRFFRQLKDRLTKTRWLEEQIVSERLFLGFFQSFELNGRALDCTLSSQQALSILRIGNKSGFLRARQEFVKDGKRSMTVVLSPLERELDLPGEEGQIHWLWHGLEMGSTELNLHSKFARVLVEADGMQTDLSLTAIPDTWERQKAVRLARQAVRDLLELLVLEFTDKRGEDLTSPDQEVEDIILEVLGERIDISRSRHRLASFNRNLIACPLFVGTDDSGKRSTYTLSELWQRVEEKQPLAYFRRMMDWRDVPPWPGRPIVLECREFHARALERIFGVSKLISATELIVRLEKLKSDGEGVASEEAAEIDPLNPCSGTLDYSGRTLSWEWSQTDPQPGRLVVVRQGEPFFVDRTCDLPNGFRFVVEADWMPDYQGQLADRTKAEALPELALRCLTNYLEQRPNPPTLEDAALSAILWELFEPQLKSGSCSDLPSTEWCVTTCLDSPSGVVFRKPSEVLPWQKEAREPSYFIEPEELAVDKPEDYEKPCLVLSKHIAERLKNVLPSPLLPVGSLRTYRLRGRFQLDPSRYRIFTYSTLECLKLDSRVSGASAGFPLRTAQRTMSQKGWLHTNLREGSLRSRSFSSFVSPVEVCLDWTEGWPDERGAYFLDRLQTEESKELAEKVTRWAARSLLGLPFSEARAIHHSAVASAWVECWTDDSLAGVPLFWRSDGSRVSSEEAKHSDSLLWYTERGRTPQNGQPPALWVPDEAVELVVEGEMWKHVEDLEEDPVEGEPSSPTKVVDHQPSDVSGSSVEETEPPSEPPVDQTATTAEKEQSETTLEECPAQEPVPQQDSLSLPGPSVEVEESPISLDIHPYSRNLLQELREVCRFGEVPFQKHFQAYIEKIPWEKTEAGYQMTDNLSLPVGAVDRLFELSLPSKKLILLSALFSQFNRQLEEVEDSHEREFLELLNQRCLKLFGSRSL